MARRCQPWILLNGSIIIHPFIVRTIASDDSENAINDEYRPENIGFEKTHRSRTPGRWLDQSRKVILFEVINSIRFTSDSVARPDKRTVRRKVYCRLTMN